MSKLVFDEFLDEDPFFNPCTSCGCSDFYMDWDDSIYRCTSCNKPMESSGSSHAKRNKSKPKVRKFKDLAED